MKFALAHKATSYFMVACAFLGLLAGGGVPSPVALAGIVGLVLSWWWETPRVRVERWAGAWGLVSIAVLAWTVVTGVTTGDWFGAAAGFLIWLVVAKAFNRRASKDWQQLHLLSFLMLIAGAVLDPGLAFGVAFLGFVVAATWALILSHLRREMEDNFLLKHADDRSERVEVRRILESRRIVGGRFFVGTGLVSLVVFTASALLFLSIPRVGAGFFMRKQRGLSFVGFKDGVKLGGHGTLKDDPTIVMRAEVPAAYQGRDAPELHWRGVAFDEYSHGEWRRSPRAPQTLELDQSEGARVRRHLLQAAALDRPGSLDDRIAAADRQTVFLEDIDTDVLFGASMPIAFEQDVSGRDPESSRDDEIRFEHPGSVRYTVWSVIARPDEATLRAAPAPHGPRVEPFLQLPDGEITQRTRDLAHTITLGATTEYDKAIAIEAWLGSHLAYTTELADPGEQEPVDFFLFDRKAGHCEYFASAFAILARAVQVPTREVNGFLGGEWNEYDDYVAVRAGDAHSWDEVWFDGVGWVTFDATPSSQDQLGRGGDGLGDRLGRYLDSLRFQWSKWVVEYDLARQRGLFKDVGDALKGAGRWVSARAREAASAVKRHAVVLAVLGAIAIAALVGWRLRRRRLEPRPGATPRPRARPAIATLYASVLAQLAKRGIPRAPSTTPRELARELAARQLPFAAAFGELTELYYAAMWGGDDATIARAQGLADVILRVPG